MAAVSSPYGFRPVGLIGSRSAAGGTRMYPIASGYAANIFTGDVCQTVAAGGIEVEESVGTNADPFTNPIGVFMGCSYTDPTLGYKVHSAYWPTGTVASDAVAYIHDDPQALYQVQGDAALAATTRGINCGINLTAGSTVFGQSRFSLDVATVAVTATVGFRIVDFVEDGANTAGDAFTDVVVMFNPGIHSYDSGLGV